MSPYSLKLKRCYWEFNGDFASVSAVPSVHSLMLPNTAIPWFRVIEPGTWWQCEIPAPFGIWKKAFLYVKIHQTAVMEAMKLGACVNGKVFCKMYWYNEDRPFLAPHTFASHDAITQPVGPTLANTPWPKDLLTRPWAEAMTLAATHFRMTYWLTLIARTGGNMKQIASCYGYRNFADVFPRVRGLLIELGVLQGHPSKRNRRLSYFKNIIDIPQEYGIVFRNGRPMDRRKNLIRRAKKKWPNWTGPGKSGKGKSRTT